MTEDSPINDEAQEETPARQDVDVLLDVSELGVDRIELTVRDLRAHVSVVAELASLVSLQVCGRQAGGGRARNRGGLASFRPSFSP